MKAGPPSRAVDLEQRVAELAMKYGAFDLGCDGTPVGWKYYEHMVSNRNLLFQGSIFSGYVSFREGNIWEW